VSRKFVLDGDVASEHRSAKFVQREHLWRGNRELSARIGERRDLE
jgi:hypothetical protein